MQKEIKLLIGMGLVFFLVLLFIVGLVGGGVYFVWQSFASTKDRILADSQRREDVMVMAVRYERLVNKSTEKALTDNNITTFAALRNTLEELKGEALSKFQIAKKARRHTMMKMLNNYLSCINQQTVTVDLYLQAEKEILRLNELIKQPQKNASVDYEELISQQENIKKQALENLLKYNEERKKVGETLKKLNTAPTL